MKEWKGINESRVLHSADITQFCLRKSSSGSYLTVNVNCRDVCITPDTYFCAERKGGSEPSVLHSAAINQFCLRNSSSGSYVTLTLNCRDVRINTDTYLSAREEGRK
jgi:putative lipoic acid-binding regulatory protein